MTINVIVDLLTAQAMHRVPADTCYIDVRAAVTTRIGALLSDISKQFDLPATPERLAHAGGPRVAFERLDEPDKPF